MPSSSALVQRKQDDPQSRSKPSKSKLGSSSALVKQHDMVSDTLVTGEEGLAASKPPSQVKVQIKDSAVREENTQLKQTVAALEQNIDDERPISRHPDKKKRMKWFRYILTTEFVLLACTLGVTYASVQTHAAQTVFDRVPLVFLGIVLFSLLMIFVISFGRTYQYCTWTQVLILLLIWLAMTSILCFVTMYLDQPLFLKAAGMATVMIFSLMVYALNPWFGFSTFWAAGYVGVVSMLALVFFVYMPNRDFFDHPGPKMLHPSSTIVETGLLYILASMLTLYFVFKMHKLSETLGLKQWLYASTRIYTDSMKILIVAVRWAFKLMNVTSLADTIDNASAIF